MNQVLVTFHNGDRFLIGDVEIKEERPIMRMGEASKVVSDSFITPVHGMLYSGGSKYQVSTHINQDAVAGIYLIEG